MTIRGQTVKIQESDVDFLLAFGAATAHVPAADILRSGYDLAKIQSYMTMVSIQTLTKTAAKGITVLANSSSLCLPAGSIRSTYNGTSNNSRRTHTPVSDADNRHHQAGCWHTNRCSTRNSWSFLLSVHAFVFRHQSKRCQCWRNTWKQPQDWYGAFGVIHSCADCIEPDHHGRLEQSQCPYIIQPVSQSGSCKQICSVEWPLASAALAAGGKSVVGTAAMGFAVVTSMSYWCATLLLSEEEFLKSIKFIPFDQLVTIVVSPTCPETNSLPQKISGWKMQFPFWDGWSIFNGELLVSGIPKNSDPIIQGLPRESFTNCFSELIEPNQSWYVTLPETNMTSPLNIGRKNRPKRKWIIFQPMSFRGKLAVSFREGNTYLANG